MAPGHSRREIVMQKHAPDRRHHRCAPKDMSTFETTPSEVTPEIEEFLATVGKGAPRLVDVGRAA